ncbi:membrane protein [Siccirubricoccus deserti]|uniref:Phage holin family protein n=1 Tax=Siccirubricoccus deserti TaxID=2013562 RepID=A0A9X0UDJ0_9PROT|nr:phage holin family protein [Siccirubricoccus deserti]MBC4015731.1 phage holin family protein [Siccirubricoccus deserti]GGC44131.1 membrane protein [Siccirubricoccus deserti]
MGFLARLFINAFALWIATELVPGLEVRGFGTLLLAALVFGVVNAVVRPVAVILSLPLTLVTLGLFLLVVNAAMLGLTALLLPGFRVEGFWSALFGAIAVSIVSWAAARLFTAER